MINGEDTEALGVAAQAAWLALTGLGGQVEVASPRMPQVTRDSAGSALGGRYLLLHPSGKVVEQALLPADASRVARELPEAGRADPSVTEMARALVTGNAGDGPPAAARLAAAGVGFVGLAPSEPTIAGRLDTTAGLARLADASDPPLWRVTPSRGGSATPVPPAAVRALDAAGDPIAALPVRGPGPKVGDATLPPGARTLAVARSAGWSRTAVVRADGRTLRPSEADGLATYSLPSGTRRVSVEPRWARPAWTWVQVGAAVAVLLLALPFGVRRRPGGEVVR